MNSRNKSILCFCIVMFITLICCSMVAASDNAVNNTTTTTTHTATQVAKEINYEKTNTIKTDNTLAQSDDNTIEETDDKNAVKQENKNAKAKINKVNITQQTVKTATTITTASDLTGTHSGDYILSNNITLNNAGVQITGDYTLDGQGNTISGVGSSTYGQFFTTSFSPSEETTIKFVNVVFKDATKYSVNIAGSGTTYTNKINVIIENCTFTGTAPVNVQYARMSISDSYFDNLNSLITAGQYSRVTVANIYKNGNLITYSDIGTSSKALIIGGSVNANRGRFAMVNLPFDYVKRGVSNTFTYTYHTTSGTSTSNPTLSTALLPSVTTSYPGMEPNTISVTNGKFTGQFDEDGVVTVNYTYLGTDDFLPVTSNKEIAVGSIIVSGPEVIECYIGTQTGNDIKAISIYPANFTYTTATGKLITAQTTNAQLGSRVYILDNGEEASYFTRNVTNGVASGEQYYYFTSPEAFYARHDTQNRGGARWGSIYFNDSYFYVLKMKTEFLGHPNYDASNHDNDPITSICVLREPTKTTITSGSVDQLVNTRIDLKATVTNSTGNVNQGNVTFKVGDTVLGVSPVSNGVATLSKVWTEDLEGDLTATFVDKDYLVYSDGAYEGTTRYHNDSVSESVSFKVIKPKSNITINSIPDTLNVNEQFTFNIKLTDVDGTNLNGKSIKVFINGEEQVTTPLTTSSGQVSVSYTPKNNSALSIEAKFEGDDNYANSSALVNIDSSKINLIPTLLTVNVTDSVIVNQNVTIKANITSGATLLNPENITVTVDDTPIPVENYVIEDNQLTLNYTPTTSGTPTIVVSYNDPNGVYQSASKSTTINVNRKQSFVVVDYVNFESSEALMEVYFLDEEDNFINEGTFHLNLNNSEDYREDYDLSDLEKDYKWLIEMIGGKYYIKIGQEFFDEQDIPYAFVTYYENEVYESSKASRGEMLHKQYLDIIIDVADEAYINEKVPINITLNYLGNNQNGQINFIVGDYTVLNKTCSKYTGYPYNYTNGVSGEYTVKVEYLGSGAYFPLNATKTFYLKKYDTNTTVTINNNTAGNVSFIVNVKNMTNGDITSGNIEVTVNGVSRVVSITGSNTLINLNEIGIGIDTTDEISVSIKYQGDEKNSPSEGYVKDELDNYSLLESITADPATSLISVNTEPENATISESIDIWGYITEVDGTPIITDNINITIINPEDEIVTSLNVSSSGRGYYNNEFQLSPEEYAEGTYKVNVSYYDKNHEIVNVTKTFNLSKVSTIVELTELNNTAGNITYQVKVTDVHGNIIPITSDNITITHQGIVLNTTVKSLEMMNWY